MRKTECYPLQITNRSQIGMLRTVISLIAIRDCQAFLARQNLLLLHTQKHTKRQTQKLFPNAVFRDSQARGTGHDTRDCLVRANPEVMPA